MIIVGCDFHPGWQQVAVFDSATGEIREEKLENGLVRRSGFMVCFRHRRELVLRRAVTRSGSRICWIA